MLNNKETHFVETHEGERFIACTACVEMLKDQVKQDLIVHMDSKKLAGFLWLSEQEMATVLAEIFKTGKQPIYFVEFHNGERTICTNSQRENLKQHIAKESMEMLTEDSFGALLTMWEWLDEFIGARLPKAA